MKLEDNKNSSIKNNEYYVYINETSNQIKINKSQNIKEEIIHDD